jgi:predicted dehydrogenase
MHFLVGRVEALVADCFTATVERRDDQGAPRAVTNPDAGHVMCRFANGARGSVQFSRIASGRKFCQSYTIYGTKGALHYDYDEMNRLHLYSGSDPAGRQGFRAIDVGPDRPSYAAFLPLPNLTLGYNETKIIEAAEVIRSIATNTPAWPSFDDGLHITEMVEACMTSSRDRAWISLPGG